VPAGSSTSWEKVVVTPEVVPAAVSGEARKTVAAGEPATSLYT
jgi:hypothetical protein